MYYVVIFIGFPGPPCKYNIIIVKVFRKHIVIAGYSILLFANIVTIEEYA